MRGSALAFVVAVGAVGGVASCFGTSGLSDGATATDAGAGSDDHAAPPPDGDGDVGPGVDGAGPGDSGSDAGGNCRSAFFDSFDNGAVGDRWDSLDQVGAALSFDGTDYRSSPSSLLATITDSSTAVKARLTKSFTPVKHVCAEFAIRMGAAVTDVVIYGMGDKYSVSFSTGPGNSSVGEYYYNPVDAGGINPRTIGNLPFSNAWQRVLVDLAFPAGAGKGSLSVTVNGTLALKSAVGGNNFDLTLNALALGITYGNAQTTGTVRFDDVGYAFPP